MKIVNSSNQSAIMASRIALCFLLLFFLPGCASYPKIHKEYEVTRSVYDVSEPPLIVEVKGIPSRKKHKFSRFEISFINQSTKTVAINWNKSTIVENGGKEYFFYTDFEDTGKSSILEKDETEYIFTTPGNLFPEILNPDNPNEDENEHLQWYRSSPGMFRPYQYKVKPCSNLERLQKQNLLQIPPDKTLSITACSARQLLLIKWFNTLKHDEDVLRISPIKSPVTMQFCVLSSDNKILQTEHTVIVKVAR